MNARNIHIFSDMMALLGRLMRHIFRSIDTVITVTITPIGIMLLFVYVFGGSMGNGMSTPEYVNYILPGILIMSIASAIAYTAIRLFTDVKSGFFDRFRSMPIAPSAALWAHVLTSLVSNALSLVIIFLTAFLMGFRTNASLLNWLAIFGILTLFTLALTWISVIAGLKAKSAEGSSAFSYPLVFLPFISSAFIPTNTMPTLVRTFAEKQPVTAVIDSIRILLANGTPNDELITALIWCMAILLVGWFFAMRVYRNMYN